MSPPPGDAGSGTAGDLDSGFDLTRLADPDALASHDHARLLWTLATAGAQLRRAGQVATEWDPRRLALPDPPRAVLVATDTACAGIAALLTVLAEPVAPVVTLHAGQLPRWAGAADAALIVSLDGQQARLAALTDQAARRGLSLAVVAPAGSPVAVAAGRDVVIDLASDTNARAVLWTALGPALLVAESWSLLPEGSVALEQVAGGADEVAQLCRPGSDVVVNPAKALAEQLAGATSLVVGGDELSAVAATVIADSLRLAAGATSLALRLPDELPAVAALLGTGDGTDEFFRDRVDDSGTRPVVVLVGAEQSDDDADQTAMPPTGDQERGELLAARQAAVLVRQLAHQHGAQVHSLPLPAGPPLLRFVAAVALGQFTAAYLALGQGSDPSTPHPGERW